jgi:hypothetical protein
MNNFEKWSHAELEQYAADMEMKYIKMRDQWRTEIFVLAPVILFTGVGIGYAVFGC